jgi:DNA-binding SARP family transcriptional activator
LDQLRFFFLGEYKAEYDGRPLRAFESDKARLLLAYLAVEKDRAHRRENLAGLFWPEKPESQAHHSLSQALSSLSRRVKTPTGVPLFEMTPQDICFRAGSAWVDVHEFDDLVEVSARHTHSITWDCRPCLDRLEGASVLYAGEFLLGLSLKGCLELEEWLRLQRETFRMKMIRALGWLSQGWEVAGELEKALDFANRWWFSIRLTKPPTAR